MVSEYVEEQEIVTITWISIIKNTIAEYSQKITITTFVGSSSRNIIIFVVNVDHYSTFLSESPKIFCQITSWLGQFSR